jgi:hypothetical protein
MAYIILGLSMKLSMLSLFYTNQIVTFRWVMLYQQLEYQTASNIALILMIVLVP